MPEPVFTALVENLPEVESRQHASVAQLSWLVHSALSKERTQVADWLPGFAQVTQNYRGWKGLPIGWRADIAVAVKYGWMRQELLDAALQVSDSKGGE